MTARTFMGLALALVAGCAAAPAFRGSDADLHAARQAYQRAAWGPAPAVNARELEQAKQALDAAEKAYRERPDAQETRDLLYIAMRRCELVEARTGIVL